MYLSLNLLLLAFGIITPILVVCLAVAWIMQIASYLKLAKSTIDLRWLMTLSIIGAISSCIVYINLIQPQLFVGKQVMTCGNMQSTSKYLNKYYDIHGHYPGTLEEAIPEKWNKNIQVDLWGYPYYYESDGTYFILASYGKDGIQDNSDYKEYRDKAIQEGDNFDFDDIAGSWKSDQVLSDVGWLRFGGK